MTGQGGRSFDFIRQLTANVVNLINKRPAATTAPCDGLVLKMHYQWTFWLFLGGFSAVWYSWYNRDVILCASHFNAETQVRLDYLNICLSYPYVETGLAGERRYLLFYRWVHWVFLLLSGIYYIPRKMSKNYESPKLKKLFEDLSIAVHRYDHFEKESVDRAVRYLAYNMKTHNGLYFKYLQCNIVALAIDIMCFHFLDFIFQGRFLSYGFNVYPFNRDPVQFQDPMSLAFPQFAKCELTQTVQLLNKRTEMFGCHLTVMELYEKIFLAVWLWLIILIVVTVVYIIYLFVMWLPWARLIILKVAKPNSGRSSVRGLVCKVISTCKIGDVYLLYRLRQFFSHKCYYDLLNRMSDPDLVRKTLDSIVIDQQGNKGNNQDPRQRKPNMKGSGNERWLS